ncbi:MAG: tRNA threonylcarbamoyladenosine dehydratase [Clostridia bacterium]|nr:tRNA threonylcarbamoyladenosine dehydratase [Clostridia bacterium]
MSEEFIRTECVLGKEAIRKLNNSKVLLFGIGGVGGYVAEALVRCGIGTIAIVDNDTISLSNINRQIIALHSTIGMKKTDVMKERLIDINPNCKVICYPLFFTAETCEINFEDYDYVIDAIDTVTSKIEIIRLCKEKNIPIISSMGTGNKLRPDLLEISDISKTSVCPLARVMRKELSKRSIKNVKVLFSTEQPISAVASEENNRHAPGSTAFVPASAGLLIASEVVKDLTK